jgi:cobalamin biosynthesis protein CobD/CbiB
MPVVLTALAVLIELIAGYPDWLVRSIGHPVTWMGRLIAGLERRWNRETLRPHVRRMVGAVAVLLLVGIVGMVALIIERGLLLLPFGLIGAAVAASTLPMRSRAAVSAPRGRRYRTSLAVIPRHSMKQASLERLSKVWQRIFPMGWSRRSSR